MKIQKRIFLLFTGILLVFPFHTFAQINKQDTLKICALRVQFQKDNNELTTGDGQFMIDTTTTDPYAIDPAPHDKQYFQDQITAAANYFNAVSKGLLTVVGDVFPKEAKAAFTLNKPMSHYNPNTTDEEINKGISRLFVDAIKAADRSGEGIDFSKYDLVVIFHAGVGRDVALDYDPTPQDIPSLFLNDRFFKKTLGDTFDGIAVNNGSFKIHQGILSPETENQEGHAIALTGFLVSNIGSYLGLYDLFSPTTQRSGVGRFGLMDAGLLNLNGLVPAPPGAFSRMLLDWDQPVTIDSPQANIPVARLFAQNPSSTPTLYKVPINDDEYYLIECRGVPNVNIDSLYQTLYTDNGPAPTYMQVLKTFFPDQIEFGPSGVLTKVANYDLGLPGSGILIWHIDERIIREKGAENKINDDPEQRGVDIEEADASQDIGQNYSLLDAGYQTELGWFADFWFKNRPPYIKNFELYTNEFSSTSHPATLSNRDHAFTHVKLYDFSDNIGDVMHFSFAREMSESGFPLKLNNNGKITQWIGYRDINNVTYFYLGDQNGNVFSIRRNSENGLPVVQPVWTDSSSAVRKLTVINGSGFFKLAVAYQTRIVITPYTYVFGEMSPSSIFEWQAPAAIMAGPVSYDDRMYVVCANDSLYEFQIAKDKLELLSRKAGFGHFKDLAMMPVTEIPDKLLKRDSVLTLGVSEDASPNGRFFALTKEDSQTVVNIIPSEHTKTFMLPQSPVGHFALANLTEGEIPEFVFNAKQKIYAYNFNGTLVTQFPLTPVLDAGDALVGTPLIADLNGDGKPEMIAVTKRGVVLALDLNNRLLANFPLSAGGSVTLSPILIQWDDDNTAELGVVTESGRIYLWNVDGSSVDGILWGQADLDGTNNKIFRVYLSGKRVPTENKDLLPANTVYNYPNPNQGDFTNIRFYLTAAADVNIRIFDLSGNWVVGFNLPGKANTDNEVRWDVSKVASGVYLCQVEAKAGGKTQRRLFKIMVVH